MRTRIADFKRQIAEVEQQEAGGQRAGGATPGLKRRSPMDAVPTLITQADPIELVGATIAQLNRIILGKEQQLRLSISCMLARGHLLIEDIPGVGKTTLAHALAESLGLSYQRIQFTSDLLPADIIGVSVFERETSTFQFHKGPVFAQLVLADEINRATPKAQSALLEAMEEHQVTADGQTYPLSNPFFVDRHAEPGLPDRHLSAAGIAARPLPDAHPARLSGRDAGAPAAARPGSARSAGDARRRRCRRNSCC